MTTKKLYTVIIFSENTMEDRSMTTKKLYTVIIFSENTVGLLNQITIIFTRRQLNIETLSVSPSALPGIHKFTITTFADEDMIDKVVKQIDKRVDILKAYYNTDEDLVFQEIALYKLSTELFIKMGTVEELGDERVVRRLGEERTLRRDTGVVPRTE